MRFYISLDIISYFLWLVHLDMYIYIVLAIGYPTVACVYIPQNNLRYKFRSSVLFIGKKKEKGKKR